MRRGAQLLGNHDRTADPRLVFRPSAAPSEEGADVGGSLTGVADYFQRLRPRRMIVTGAPGAGKTVLAVQLMPCLVEQGNADEPVPVRRSRARIRARVLHVPDRAASSGERGGTTASARDRAGQPSPRGSRQRHKRSSKLVRQAPVAPALAAAFATPLTSHTTAPPGATQVGPGKNLVAIPSQRLAILPHEQICRSHRAGQQRRRDHGAADPARRQSRVVRMLHRYRTWHVWRLGH
ncbi:hypothetical protein SAMN05216482_1111 [Streptomyces sp. PAN_FS17]|nr:hypothetical protein SAMN05216482_1111 [Streptomyces sp. PAN_FS17]